MNVTALILGVVLPAAATYLIVLAALRGRDRSVALERIGISISFFIGITSAAFFVARLIDIPLHLYPIAESSGFAVLLVSAYRWRSQESGPVAHTAQPGLVVRSMALGLIGLVVVASAFIVRERFTMAPHGDWDAWAIWNLRAAFLASPTARWADGFTMAIGWSHPDYPLLVPASVARLWTLAQNQSIAAPMMFAGAVLLATVFTMSGALLRSAGVVGVALGVSLLLVPEYLLWATSQCADVAMGLFVLTAVALFHGSPDRRRLAVAGAAAGFAAWTKNEGLLAAFAVLTAYSVVTFWRYGRLVAVRRLTQFLVGLLPVLGVLALFSVTVAPSSDLMQGLASNNAFAKVADLGRHRYVAGYMLEHFLDWGRWSLIAPTWIVLAWLLAGYVKFPKLPAAVMTSAGTLVILVAGYYWVYILTPYDLHWHVETSWSRLIAQAWPTLVWTSVSAGLASQRPVLPTDVPG